jgi:arginine:ornithine antiporter/lysine permease
MDQSKKVGFIGLVAIVVGSMIGGGIFNLPSNMAQGAALGPVIIAWVITGFGMYFLANTFRNLSNIRPDLNDGIYSYAAEGFGRYVGFNSAWGYWLSSAIGNVSFAVLLIQALGFFFPVFLKGSNWESILLGILFIWGMNMIVRRGVQGAAILNAISTVAKLVPIFLFIVILLFAFHWDKLSFDIWGSETPALGDTMKQVSKVMLVTLWAFVGIEGAVVISGRAKSSKDVGTATVIGFLGAILIYAAISIFSFGIMNRAELAQLPDPSTAYVLKAIVGDWGAVLLNVGVIISILGAWIAWTIMTSEVPSSAARKGVLPKIFGKHNKKDAPVFALSMTSIIMTLTLVIASYEKNAFLAIISISGSMILIPYVLSSLFLLKFSLKKGAIEENGKNMIMITAAMASVYTFWLVYAAGLKYILLSSILYAIGIIVYWITWKQKNTEEALFNRKEKILALGILIVAIVSLMMILQGIPLVNEAARWIVLEFRHIGWLK